MVTGFSNVAALKPPHKAGWRGGEALRASRDAVLPAPKELLQHRLAMTVSAQSSLSD